MITVRVYMTANSEKENELRNANENLCTNIVQERGCISCKLFHNTKETPEFFLIENWMILENVKVGSMPKSKDTYLDG